MILTNEMLVASKYQSHLPALLGCVASTIGDVLELGVGHFSTPQLHALCGALDRKLVSVEKDPEWLAFFKGMFGASKHHLFLSDEMAASSGKWAVSFIDHSPGGENRAAAFRALIRCSQFVVVHDYWEENEAAIAPLLGGLIFHVTKTYLPPTLVASSGRKIPDSILAL